MHRWISTWLLASSVLALIACSKPEAPSQTAGPVSNPKDLAGIWWNKNGVPALKTVAEGGDVPLNDSGRALYEASTKKVKLPPSGPADLSRCAPFGVPRVWTQPYPFQILVKPDFVAIVYEHNSMFRLAYMNEALPVDPDPAFMGHAVGKWEGDTLVIETNGFNDRTYLDDTGLPHSDKLTIVEKIRKTSDSQLEIVVSITDPEVFSRPWSTRMEFSLAPGAEIEEYICGYGAFETRFTPQQGDENLKSEAASR
jgi:hypothetical protein